MFPGPTPNTLSLCIHTLTFCSNCFNSRSPTDVMHTTYAHPHTPRHTLECRQAGTPFLFFFFELSISARCWESLVACMPAASRGESRKTCCYFRGYLLFVIFSKVTRHCRRQKIPTEIMMEKDICKSSGNPIDNSWLCNYWMNILCIICKKKKSKLQNWI